MQALDEAAAEGRVAETILLAHRAVGTHNLAEMNPADVARIAAALDAVDQSEPARLFRRDVVAAHLLAAAHAQAVDLPPVTAATSALAPESTVSNSGDGSDAGTDLETTGESSGTGGGLDSTSLNDNARDSDEVDSDARDSDEGANLTPTSGTADATVQQNNDNNL